MSGPLAQLTERNLTTAPLAVQPRLQSRFESALLQPERNALLETSHERPPEVGRETDSPSTAVPLSHAALPAEASIERQTSLPVSSQLESDARRPSIAAPAEHVEPEQYRRPPDGPSDDLLRGRIDQLDQRLSSLSSSSESAPDNEPSRQTHDVSAPRIETTEHTHHHHEHHVEHFNQTEIDQSQTIVGGQKTVERQIKIASKSPSAPAEQVDSTDLRPIVAAPLSPATLPNGPAPAVFETSSDDGRSMPDQPASPMPIHREMRTPVTARPHAEAASAPSIVASAQDNRPVGQVAPPQVVVEAGDSKQRQESHTVNVTIGRIEIRSSKPQATSPPPKTERNKPSARIMNLDDYVRSRRGGAG